MTSNERLAYARARGFGVDFAILDFPSYVHVVPVMDVKEGQAAFIATPLASIEHSPKYATIDGARWSQNALTRHYNTPQAIWMLSHANTDWGGYFIVCAATIDVGLYDTDAVRVEEVPC